MGKHIMKIVLSRLARLSGLAAAACLAAPAALADIQVNVTGPHNTIIDQPECDNLCKVNITYMIHNTGKINGTVHLGINEILFPMNGDTELDGLTKGSITRNQGNGNCGNDLGPGMTCSVTASFTVFDGEAFDDGEGPEPDAPNNPPGEWQTGIDVTWDFAANVPCDPKTQVCEGDIPYENPVVDVTDDVPEPGSWILMLAGSCVLGAVTRRRRALAALLGEET
jgi:hypothetical protein